MKEEDFRKKFQKDLRSAEKKNCIKQTTKSRSKRRKFNLGSVNVEMSIQYSYKRTLCDLDPLLGIERGIVRGVMSCSFVTSVKVNITPNLSNNGKVNQEIIVIIKPKFLSQSKDALSPREGREAKWLLAIAIERKTHWEHERGRS